MMDADIEKNQDFRNRSEWIIAAIRFYETERLRIIAERKAAFSDSQECDFAPSGSLQLRDDEVKG